MIQYRHTTDVAELSAVKRKLSSGGEEEKAEEPAAIGNTIKRGRKPVAAKKEVASPQAMSFCQVTKCWRRTARRTQNTANFLGLST